MKGQVTVRGNRLSPPGRARKDNVIPSHSASRSYAATRGNAATPAGATGASSQLSLTRQRWIYGLVAMFLSTVLSTAVCASFQPYPGSDLPADPAVTFGELPSGLRYAIKPNSEPRDRISLRLLIRAGSLQERDDQRGLAHYLEHMAFKGTENFEAGTLVEYFQNLGMSFGPDANAYTGFDRTAYQIELPDTEPDSIGDALLVLRDFADRMIIAQEEVEAERGVILSEKRTRDSVRFRTAIAEFAFLLPESILADRFPIGAEDVIRNTGSDELREFYNAWYRPELAAIIVVGDTVPETVEPMIKEYFDDFEARHPPADTPDPGRVVEHGLSARLHTETEAPATRVSIQCVHPLTPQPDTLERRREALTRSVAFQIVSRRLETLAQQENAPFSRGQATVYDLFDFFRNASIDLMTQPERWAESLTVAEHELRRALTHGFHESELEEIRANILNNLERNARRAPTRRSRNLAESLVSSLTTDRVFIAPQTELELMRPILDALTVDQCLESLRKAFPEDHRFVFVTGNVEFDDPEETILSTYRTAAQDEVKPPDDTADVQFAYPVPDEPGRVTKQIYIDDLDVYQAQLNNNIRLNVKATDFASNEVHLAVRIGGGQLTEPDGKPGLSLLASETFIRGGLIEHSADELRRMFAGRNVGWSFTVKPDAFVFRGATTPDDLELQLKLLRAYLKAAGFRPEALRHARENFEERYINARHTAQGVLRDRVVRFLAGDDPRFGLPPEDQLLALELDEVREWLQHPLLHDIIEISIVGDIETATNTINTVAAILGTLPERSNEKPDYSERRQLSRPAPETVETFTFQSRIPNAYTAVYWPVPDQWDMQRTRRLNILARVFTDRMRLRIREEMGEAYSAYAIHNPDDTYQDYGWFFGIVAIAPDMANEVAQGIMEIARDLHSGNISEDEHQRALRPVLASLRDTVRDNGYWLNSVLISAWEYPQRFEWARTMTADFTAISVADLKRLAREYLDPEIGLQINVLPAETR